MSNDNDDATPLSDLSDEQLDEVLKRAYDTLEKVVNSITDPKEIIKRITSKDN